MLDINNIIVLALGNDIMGDDGIAIHIAGILKKEYPGLPIEEIFGGGLELLDFLEGRDKALIIDTISTGQHPVGSILEFSGEDFRKSVATSPHYIGLPETLKLCSSLGIHSPDEIRILAVETLPLFEVREGISSQVLDSSGRMLEKARAVLNEWIE